MFLNQTWYVTWELGGSVSVPESVSVVSSAVVVGISSLVPSVVASSDGIGPAEVASPSELQLATRKPSEAAKTSAGTTMQGLHVCLLGRRDASSLPVARNTLLSGG